MVDDVRPFKEKVIKEIREFAQNIRELDSHTLEEFIESLRIRRDAVCGFKYISVKQKLSEKDYHALLKLVGFDPLKERDWVDQECGPPCKLNFGYSCDPVKCH